MLYLCYESVIMNNSTNTINDLIPGDAIHVGDILKDELQARHFTQKVFADLISVKPNVLSELIHKKRNMTAELAVKIEKILGIEAEFWMRIQSKYEIDCVRIKFRLQNSSYLG